MDPETPSVLSPQEINEKMSPPAKKDGHAVTIISMAVFVLLSLGAVAFLYYQNQQLKQMIASYATPPPSATPSPSASQVPTGTLASPSATLSKPVITSPKPGAKVASPLTVTGTIPAGWMFEGVFPIKLVDANKDLIVQGQAKEKVAGSWQTGNPVEFSATLTFTTTAKSGFLILENDNPSGDPTKSETFQVPVNF